MSVKTSNKKLEQIQKDLNLTVKELSDVYEEISILYHLSQTLTGLTIDQICNTLLEEVQVMFDVKTAAILLFDESKKEIYTAVSNGKWPLGQVFKQGNNIIWNAIEKNKPQVLYNFKSSLFKTLGINSILVCPLVGKKKVVGAIVTGEKTSGEEFFSSDTKLLMAIASQAALSIENAFLYQEMEAFFFGTVMAFVKATESRSKWTSGHSERVTRYSLAIAKKMGMDKNFTERLKICGLLHDIGKIATPVEILDKKGKLSKNELLEVRQHPLTGSMILSDLKPFRDIVLGIKHHHEKWNGKGVPHKLKKQKIPIMARIIAVADAFDAMTSDRPYRKKIGLDACIKELTLYAGKQFDPQIVKVLIKIKDTLLT